MAEKGKYTSIRMPIESYELVQQARRELAKRGYGSLPDEVIFPTKCPVCGLAMEKIEVRYGYYKCQNCGHRQQSLDMNATGKFALGAIIGLGTAALLYLLSQHGKK